MTVFDHGIRAGDRVALIDLPDSAMPTPFWDKIKRVAVSVCYADVFDDHWLVTETRLGDAPLSWRTVGTCPPQPDSTYF